MISCDLVPRILQLQAAFSDGMDEITEITRDHPRSPEITQAAFSDGMDEDEARLLVRIFTEITRDHTRSHEITRGAATRAYLHRDGRAVPAPPARAPGDHTRSHEITRDHTVMLLLLAHQPPLAVATAAAVMRGAAHPEPEIAQITFNFW